jgi:hypothetical protein
MGAIILPVDFYRDAGGDCPACAAMLRMDPDLRAVVSKRVEMLQRDDFENLKKNEVVKPLNGNIYELRVKGSGRFGRRAFFILVPPTCRGKAEAVVTEIAIRRKLNFDAYIRRAEAARLDWLNRNCRKSHAR